MLFRLIFCCFLLVFFSNANLHAESDDPPLTGAIVKQIVERFADMHYSEQPLDDKISEKIFSAYLDSLDPGHYYFLDSDIREFSLHQKKIDDMIQQGNVELALKIFTRFTTRLKERLDALDELVKENIDFNKDESWKIDRKNEPYPKNLKEALALWRIKIKFDLLSLTEGGMTMDASKQQVQKRVRSIWKDYSQYSDNEIISLFLNALTGAYDPHSSYLSAQDLKNFDISIKLSLEGIGAVLRWEDGYTVVNSIVPGGAAYRDGRLAVNDKVIGVAQADEPFESVVDIRLNNVVQLIRGKRGTKVRLQILREAKTGPVTMVIDIIRDQIVLKDGEAQARIFKPKSKTLKETAVVPKQEETLTAPKEFNIGVILLPSFYVDFNGRREDPNSYKSSSRDVKKHLDQFVADKVDGVVLDLRNNGGGGLDEAISMAGLLIGREPVVVVRQAGGARKFVHRSRERTVYKGPLAVLLNRYSASASEILAGAIQDYQRGLLIGDTTTFGKGTVQNIAQLPEGFGALKVTIAQFYRVSGMSTQHKGVESDIVLPSLNNVRELGESTLPNALPFKAIAPVSYQKQGDLIPYLSKLKTYSEKRMKQSDFFKEVEQNIQEYTKIKNREYTSISQIQKDLKEQSDQQKKDISEAVPVTAEKLNPDTKTASAEEAIANDAYLNEAMMILEDYIRHQRSVSKEVRTSTTKKNG